MAFMRLLLPMLVAQTVIYLCLLGYFRAGCKERLEADFPEQATERERRTFVGRGVDSYSRRLRIRLAVLVYGLPILILAGYIYWSNLR